MSNRNFGFGLGVSLLALTAGAPALGAVIDYANGSDNTSPIVLTDNSTQLQVITGTATQSGVISESGGSFGLEKIGLGTLVLTGANAYSGTTTISGNGVLQVGNNGATGSLGSGNVVNNATLNFNLTGATTVANLISGTGTVNQLGTGTLTLTAANSFSGGISVGNGSQLALSGAGSMANAGLTVNGTFDMSALATGTSIASLSGSGAVVLGSNTLAISNSLGNFNHGIFFGDIGGMGGVMITAGAQGFAGTNSYTGTTTIASGATLYTHLSQTSIASSSDVINNGTLALNVSTTITSLSGSGSVTGGSLLTITNGSGTFSGSMGLDTPMALTIAGGTETLTGAGRFSFVTVNPGASLRLSGAGALAISNDVLTDDGMFDISGANGGATVQFLTGAGVINLGNQSLTLANPAGTAFNSTFSGVITGTGGVTIAGGTGGSGAVRTFAGANTYSGATVIQSGGTLILAPGGGIVNSTIRNAGILVLTPTTVLPSGIPTVFGSFSIGSLAGTGIVNLGGNALILAHAGDTFAGSLQDGPSFIGPGGLVTVNPTGSLVIGGGTEILSGTNTYTGGTVIANGASLQLGNGSTAGSIAGNVTDNGVLAFNRSGAVSFAGLISGSGTVQQIGAGVTTLSAINTYTGSTSVSAGTLNVTGSIASSAVSVASGAKLTGTGTVGAVTVAGGGTLSPGSGGAPGILTVQGNLTLAPGANYMDAISPTVTGLTAVSGTASVDGALTVNAAAGTYAVGQRYTLLSAVGGVSGTFGSISTTGLNAYKTNIGYDANSVFLTLSANALSPLLPAGIGANGINAAKAIDAAIAGGATVNNGINALFGLSGAALGSAVTQLSGEAGADAASSGSQAFLPFMSLLTAEGTSGSPTVTAANFAPGVAYGEDDAPKPAQLAVGGVRAWGTVFGRHTGIAADPAAGTQSVKAGNAGLAAGIEMQVSDTLRLGAAAGGGHGSFSAGNGRGASDDALLGLYGNLAVLDRGYVAGAFSYGWHDVETLRLLTVSGTDLLSAKYTAHDVGARIEGGWRVALDDADGLVPYAAFAWNSYEAPAYGEHAVSGSSDFALSYAAQDTDFGQGELGLKAGRAIGMAGGTMAMELSAAWAHQLYGAPFALAAFQALPGSNFVLRGGRIATDTALLGAGLDWSGRDGLSFGARIDSQLGGGTTALAGTGTISLRW